MAIVDWKRMRNKSAILALSDGTVFRGFSFGANIDALGEVVFNTGMCGYQEIISDASYAGQFVTMTYPEIGNVGINSIDIESGDLHLRGLIVSSLNYPSSWRSELPLDKFLEKKNVPAIGGIDTRALTTLLREKGTQKAFLHCSNEEISEKECIKRAKDWVGLDNQDYASVVSCKKSYESEELFLLGDYWGLAESLPEVEYKVAVYDFGVKWNILRCMRVNGIASKVFPAKTPIEDILKEKFDGVFLSNGPADPSAVGYAILAAKELIGKIPIMGICLGHQILSIAAGGVTSRLKFGHHGCNHPVKNLLTGAVEITSQNHNYAVNVESIKKTNLDVTHINLNDKSVEGIRHKNEPMFAVQYHPESAPGPHDSKYLFQQFKQIMER